MVIDSGIGDGAGPSKLKSGCHGSALESDSNNVCLRSLGIGTKRTLSLLLMEISVIDSDGGRGNCVTWILFNVLATDSGNDE
jgi:hypothetical protein